MTKTGKVYGLKTADSRILYVGQTTQPLARRLSGHISGSAHSTTMPVYDWIRRVGRENVEIIELEADVPADQLNVREQFFMVNLKTGVSNGGFNVKRVDDGIIGNSVRQAWQTPEVRDTYVAANRSRASTDEGRDQMRKIGSVGGSKSAVTVNHRRWHVNRGIVNPNCGLCS